ncbi:hypothetical protein F750_4460 [Streptomyces sp. PAMC 26508]|nr:hypothetical protein F750_4460 [Streptomyces sp. PAMC 26508]
MPADAHGAGPAARRRVRLRPCPATHADLGRGVGGRRPGGGTDPRRPAREDLVRCFRVT